MVLVGYPIKYRGERSLSKLAGRVVEAGFDYVEISLDYPLPMGMELSEAKRIISEFMDTGLKVAFHAPWRDIALASPVDAIREASLKVMARAMEFASGIDHLYFNLHVFSKESVSIPVVRSRVLRAGLNSLRTLARLSEKLGVEMLLENNNAQCFGQLDWLLEAVDAITDLRITMDVGHIPAAYMLDENTLNELTGLIKDWASALRGRITCLHVHNVKAVDGIIVDHLAPESGVLDFDELLELLKPSNTSYVVYECFWHDRPGGRRVDANDLSTWVVRAREALS